jgi:ribonuclease HI
MELTAAIEGLRVLVSAGDGVVVHTDSQLVVKGMTEWIGGWERRTWRKADGEPVLNAELWQALLEQVRRLGRVSWQWVKGHAGVPLNERADQLAVAAIERRSGVSEPTRARTENELLLDLERRVRKAVGAHRGQVPVYDEILDQLDAMRAKPVSTRSS